MLAVHRHLENNLYSFTLPKKAATDMARLIDKEVEDAGFKKDLTFIQNMDLVGDIISENHSPTVDGWFGHRFHSCFTRLNKRLRRLVTCNGLPVKFIDIKNSQPLLLGGLLLMKEAHGSIVDFTSHIRDMQIEEEVPNGRQAGWESVARGGTSRAPITVSKNQCFSLQSIEGADFKLRKNLSASETQWLLDAENGVIYEKLMEKYPKLVSRDQMKVLLYKDVLYKTKRYENEMTETMKLVYPEVYEFIETIRSSSSDPTLLNRLMQRFESKLILERICGRLMTDFPTMPLLTIHDAIGSTEEHMPTIQRVMEEEYAIVGLRPSFG